MQPAPVDPPEVRESQWAGFSGRVGWDVGANSGQSVSVMLDRFDRVVAFEPARESFSLLVRSWEDEPRVRFVNAAVSDRDGVLSLAEREGPIQTGQLVTEGMPYYGEDLGPNTAVWGQVTGVREVPGRSADSLARELGFPDFCKVDTEGHEVRVLRGAGLLIARRAEWLVEFHSSELYGECVEILSAAGYRVETVRHPHYAERSPMWYQHGWIRATVPPRQTVVLPPL